MKKLVFNLIFILLIISCRKTDSGTVADHFTLRNNGADMPVWVEGNMGSGAILIVVHGGPGGDGQVYNTYMEEFSNRMEENFAVCYWDQRGSGNSAGHFSASEYKVETYVDDLDKLIDVLHLKYGSGKKIFLLGHSWGGTLITAYSIDAGRQSKIAGFIEVDGAHNYLDAAIIIARFKEIANAQISLGHHTTEWQTILDFCNNIDPNNPTDAEIGQLNKYGFSAEDYLLSDGILTNLEGKINPTAYMLTGSLHYPLSWWNDLNTSTGMYPDLKNRDYTLEMSKIKVPSLFMWGEWDLVVPRASGVSGYNQCGAPDKTYTEFKQSGHSPMSNQMQDFCNVLIPWVLARK